MTTINLEKHLNEYKSSPTFQDFENVRTGFETRFNKFKYTLEERHRIYINRYSGDCRFDEWTEDEIFQRYSFCNVFRDFDRQTIWLKGMLKENADNKNLWLIPFVFRSINRGETLRHYNLSEDFDKDKFYQFLDDRVKSGKQVYNSAYTITGTPAQMKGKKRHEFTVYDSITSVLDNKDKILEILEKNPLSFAKVFKEMAALPLVGYGSFNLYQVILDLTYTKYLKSYQDGQDFCFVGPGAVKGLNIIFGRAENCKITESQAISDVQFLTMKLNENIDQSLFGETFEELDLKEFNLHIVEFWLCEFAKYYAYENGTNKRTRHFKCQWFQPEIED